MLGWPEGDIIFPHGCQLISTEAQRHSWAKWRLNVAQANHICVVTRPRAACSNRIFLPTEERGRAGQPFAVASCDLMRAIAVLNRERGATFVQIERDSVDILIVL